MNIWISVLSFIASYLSFVKMLDIYGEICSGLCVCEEREGVLTANCENKGLISVSDVRPLHFSTYHLLLTGNLLKRLSLNDFLHYEGLTILHLGNNDIAEIETGAFNGLQGLKRLHLNNNKLEVLKDNTFVGLDGLEYLQIDYNYISQIEANVLDRLYHLEVLILNDNLLSALPRNIFQFVPLTHLDLRGNQLKLLSYSGILEHMGKIVELQLEENPWNCSCELIALKVWLESISYTALVGDVVCETPFRLHGRDLDEISKQELCPRRAIAEFEMPAEPAYSTHALFRTTSASVTRPLPGSNTLRSARPTKSTRQSGKLRTKPTTRVSSSKPQNYGPALTLQTKPPVPLDCPYACTCNLQISDLGLNVNCQERKIERISDLNPKPYNPKKMYLTGNYIPSVHSSDFEEATSLDLLHLGNNRIAIIHSRAFGKLTHLRRLYLNGNLIEQLTDDMFCGLESLQFLYLEYNVIREIAVGTFEQVPNLQLLFLNNNLLKTLPTGMFRGLSLARLNLRNNHFRNLPVRGILGDLQLLVQIDLFENPWDCSCAVLEMKSWLEQLSSGTVVNSVICESPLRMSGEDLRSIHSSRFCPDTSHVEASIVPPSEESFPGKATMATALDYDTQYPTVPLSVLILALLLLFVMSVFIAAGFFAFMVRRRKRSEHSAPLRASPSSFNTLYDGRSAPKVRTSVGHVYEYFPPPTEGSSTSAAYGLGHGTPGGGCSDFDELKTALVSEERRSNAVGSEYSAGTVNPLRSAPHLQENGCFYQHLLARDRNAPYRASLPCKHADHVPVHYAPDFDVQHSYLHPERIQQTMTYCSTPATVYVEPNRSEYWELKAKLHFEPDYLEVHEKRTTFTQF